MSKDLVEKAAASISDLRRHVDGLETELKRTLGELSKYERVSTREALHFLKEPWCILPKSREEWWVVVPKWAGVQVGWLERATETYNIFVVNRYSHWLGGIPDELREKLELPDPVDATVVDGRLKADPEVAEKLSKHLFGKDKEGFKVRKGHEFELMADLIEMGSLPFAPKEVDPKDLRPWKFEGPPSNLRDYQEEAWKVFLKYGAAGVFLPFGTGKTVIGCYACGRLVGRKLIVCPTKTLIEQWRERLGKWVRGNSSQEVEIVTYNAWKRIKEKEWTVAIFDEAHRLPANSFSRLASIRTKYRIGLSASPYREDGRTRYIFALTGYPVGVDWTSFIRSGFIHKPDVTVRIVSGWQEKARVAEAEARTVKNKAVIFCDSIDRGRALSGRLSVPHIYSQTKDRLGVLRKSKVSVVSRVGDEGLSIPDLEKVIEVDFHGGSRRQEAQRVGRLFHANGKGEHLILMTQDEFDRFENRFLALEEKGIKVQVRQK